VNQKPRDLAGLFFENCVGLPEQSNARHFLNLFPCAATPRDLKRDGMRDGWRDDDRDGLELFDIGDRQLDD
jgi:hypothetical protein